MNLPKASVGPKQLKKNSVTSPKVKRGSLLVSDFKASQRARLRGPGGPQGTQGVAGPAGATKVTSRVSEYVTIAPDGSETVLVNCNPGEVATGGGIGQTNGTLLDMQAVTSVPLIGAGDLPRGWAVRAANTDSNTDNMGTISVAAFAVCASP